MGEILYPTFGPGKINWNDPENYWVKLAKKELVDPGDPYLANWFHFMKRGNFPVEGVVETLQGIRSGLRKRKQAILAAQCQNIRNQKMRLFEYTPATLSAPSPAQTEPKAGGNSPEQLATVLSFRPLHSQISAIGQRIHDELALVESVEAPVPEVVQFHHVGQDSTDDFDESESIATTSEQSSLGSFPESSM